VCVCVGGGVVQASGAKVYIPQPSNPEAVVTDYKMETDAKIIDVLEQISGFDRESAADDWAFCDRDLQVQILTMVALCG